MSVHNGTPWVRDTVASVLARAAGELVVIDDGSTDATMRSSLMSADREAYC